MPFLYSLTTRFKPTQDRVSWLLVQYVPVLYLAAIGGALSSASERCIVAIVAIVCWQVFYEIGYIHNDVITTKFERSPTLRVNGDLLEFGRRKFASIACVRIGSGLLLLAAIAGLAKALGLHVNFLAFAAVVAVTMISFVVHNSVRGVANIFTYSILSIGRYASVPVLIAPEDQMAAYGVVSVLMVPLVRILEHSCKP